MANAPAVEQFHCAFALERSCVKILIGACWRPTTTTSVDLIELIRHELVRATVSSSGSPLCGFTCLCEVIVLRTECLCLNRAVQVICQPHLSLCSQQQHHPSDSASRWTAQCSAAAQAYTCRVAVNWYSSNASTSSWATNFKEVRGKTSG